MRFTFDANKDVANIAKHGLSLADGPLVFNAPGKFHSDNGSEYVNATVAKMLEKMRVEQTKSRPGAPTTTPWPNPRMARW